MKRSSSYSSDSGSDVEAGPEARRPSPSRRLQGQVVLALASACVFSVAVIGRTHPPFPAPTVRRRDEATDAPTLTPSPQDPFSVYGAEVLKKLNDDAWWRFICRLVVRNGTRTSLYVERHATRNYAHALYNTVLYNRMCLERGGIAAEEASLTLPASLASQRGAIERELGTNISLTFSRAAKHPPPMAYGPVGKFLHEALARRQMGRWLRDRPRSVDKCPHHYHAVIVKRNSKTRRSLENWDAVAAALSAVGVRAHIIEPDASWSWDLQRRALSCADALVCFHGAGCANGVWLRRPSLLVEVKSRWFSPWGTIFGHVGASYASVHADRLERTDRRGFLHLRTKYWRDGRFRLSEAGINSIVAAVEAHRNPAAAWPLWVAVAVLAVGALAALSFIRRSEESHSHLK